MHFNIIQIDEKPIPKDERINEIHINDDPLIEMETDYAGDTKKYSEVIDTIQDELRPFATVNVRRRTIRFRSRQAVERKLQKAVNATVRNFKENMKNKAYWTAEMELRHGVTEPFGIDDLFYHGHCQKFSQVISDYLAGYLPQTLYIGSILDAHA